MRKNHGLTKGFTIIELLVYMGILGILLTVFVSLFATVLDVQLESESTSGVVQDGTYILAKLTHDIQSAGAIVTPSALGSTTNDLQLTINGVSNVYTLDGNDNLTLVNNNGTNNINSNESSISSFSVQRVGNAGKTEDTINISLVLTSRAVRGGGKQEVRNFSTTVALRAQ